MSNDVIQSTIQIPFTQVHNKVIDSEGFQKPIDKLVYISLMRFAFQKGHAFPSIKKLSKMNVSSENTIRASLKRLQEMGLVSKQERKEGKKQFSNLYYLHDLPDEMVKDREDDTPPQKLKGGSSKIEGRGVQKLKGTPSKIEDEEKELNNNTRNNNNKNNNQSIKESDITKLDVPMSVQKQMIMNKDRLIDDSINIHDIEILFNLYQNKINEHEFCLVLSNVLEGIKEPIRNFKSVMTKSIDNHIKQPQQTDNEQIESNEVIPDWFKNRKKETSYAEDYSQFDFSKRKNPDWLNDDQELSGTLKAFNDIMSDSVEA